MHPQAKSRQTDMQAATSQTRTLQGQRNGRHSPCWVPWRKEAILAAFQNTNQDRSTTTAGGREAGLCVLPGRHHSPSGFFLVIKEGAHAPGGTVKSEIPVCLEFRQRASIGDKGNTENRQKSAPDAPSSCNHGSVKLNQEAKKTK